jgi:drug/metabolite transporter (DMT)-like permease
MTVSRKTATALGIVALGFWSTSVALARGLVEPLGANTFLALNYGLAGAVLFFFQSCRERSFRWIAQLSPRHLGMCGLFFAGYCGGFATSLALAPDRQVALQLGVVNYLWPGWTLVFSIAVFRYRPRWLFLLTGILLGILGIILVALPGATLESMWRNLSTNRLAFLLMLLASASWGLYSNLSRKHPNSSGVSAVPVFLLGVGAIFLAMRFLNHEQSSWNRSVVVSLLYSILFPSAVSYLFWEIAVQKGDFVLLGALSYLVPLVSTLFACWYLSQPAGWPLVAGSIIIILAALLCKRGVTEKAASEQGVEKFC